MTASFFYKIKNFIIYFVINKMCTLMKSYDIFEMY